MHTRASSEQAWEPMASSSTKFCRKKRTVHHHAQQEIGPSCTSTFSVWTEYTVPAGKRAITQQEYHWSHAWQRFKRSKGVKLNDILEGKSWRKSRNAPSPSDPDSNSRLGTYIIIVQEDRPLQHGRRANRRITVRSGRVEVQPWMRRLPCDRVHG